MKSRTYTRSEFHTWDLVPVIVYGKYDTGCRKARTITVQTAVRAAVPAVRRSSRHLSFCCVNADALTCIRCRISCTRWSGDELDTIMMTRRAANYNDAVLLFVRLFSTAVPHVVQQWRQHYSHYSV